MLSAVTAACVNEQLQAPKFGLNDLQPATHLEGDMFFKRPWRVGQVCSDIQCTRIQAFSLFQSSVCRSTAATHQHLETGVASLPVSRVRRPS